jgi:hypothetical protein
MFHVEHRVFHVEHRTRGRRDPVTAAPGSAPDALPTPAPALGPAPEGLSEPAPAPAAGSIRAPGHQWALPAMCWVPIRLRKTQYVQLW